MFIWVMHNASIMPLTNLDPHKVYLHIVKKCNNKRVYWWNDAQRPSKNAFTKELQTDVHVGNWVIIDNIINETCNRIQFTWNENRLKVSTRIQVWFWWFVHKYTHMSRPDVKHLYSLWMRQMLAMSAMFYYTCEVSRSHQWWGMSRWH